MLASMFVLAGAAAQDQQEIDWNDKEQFTANFEDYPAAAFENNPAKAWETIEQNPSLLATQNILDEAFANNAPRAASVLDHNVHLLETNENVRNKLDTAAVGNVVILNDNPTAKAALLEKKYAISMDDKMVEIKLYDGTKMTTGGERGTAFNVKAVPEAAVQADGSLRFRDAVIEGTADFTLTKDSSGEDRYNAKGGIITFDPKTRNLPLAVEEGTVRMPYDETGSKVITYEGNFEVKSGPIGAYFEEISGTKVTGTFTRSVEFFKDGTFQKSKFPPMNIEGTIFQEQGEPPHRMIFLEKTTAAKPDGTVIEVNTQDRVYYTEASRKEYRSREQVGDYCTKNAGFSCIINLPGETYDDPFRERLAFLNVQKGDAIAVKTPAYFDRVEILNQQGGEITVASIDDGNIVAEIKSSANTPPQFKGTIENMKAGRFDVLYNKDRTCAGEGCEKLLHHWSSNKFQRDPSYFQKPRDHFATCTFGKDCEEIFAENFGRIVPPRDLSKKISTTIIVAGDNSYTPQSMSRYCQQEGCYIINSRDVPPTTASSRLVVTGHHFEGTDHVWRDPPTVSGRHRPIDKLYFASVEGGSPFDALPQGNVEHISFSSCNTALEADYEGFKNLRRSYQHLQSIQGWDGKAPLYERINTFAVTEQEQKQEAVGNKKFSRGERAWYIKQPDGSWIQTNGRDQPELIVSSEGKTTRELGDIYYDDIT